MTRSKTLRVSPLRVGHRQRLYDETGVLKGGTQAWQNAKDYVTGTGTGLISQFGFDMPRVVAADVLNHPDILPYNYARTKSVGET